LSSSLTIETYCNNRISTISKQINSIKTSSRLTTHRLTTNRLTTNCLTTHRLTTYRLTTYRLTTYRLTIYDLIKTPYVSSLINLLTKLSIKFSFRILTKITHEWIKNLLIFILKNIYNTIFYIFITFILLWFYNKNIF